jgi:toxin-antitoxin system PIN domain toxin
MKALDTNILVHAFLSNSPINPAARAEINALASGRLGWAIPWPCIHEFFAVVTNRKLGALPARAMEAQDQISAWMSSPSLQILSETPAHWQTLQSLIKSADVSGGLIHDAKIAALCLDHGVTEFITLDRDFSRFPQLNVRSLLAP